MNRGLHPFIVFRAVLISILLVVYVLGAVGTGVLNEIAGHHPEHSHSIEKESDPCHRTIFHQDKIHGCKHTSHISKIEKCNCGHTLFSGYVIPRSFSIGKELFNLYYSYFFPTSALLSESHPEITLRGPPHYR